ncbi:transposable element Tc1 transposase [Trichonephila clavipes]|nr:transposable element Tc1 transposase [Trichonephila clavipes]
MRGRIIGKIEKGRKITDVAREFDIGCGSHLKLLECVVDGTGEVVLEVRRLQKTDISSYQQKGTGEPQLSRWQISFLLPQESRSPEKLLPDLDRLECAVRNCWEQWTREGTQARKTGSGATRKTTRKERRRIVRQALVDPTVTRSTIRADVGVAIVPQTISRHLAEANLKSKCPFRALRLTPEHRQLRLQWCQARSMWNVTDWQNVVFRDESRFVLGTDDNRVWVWRRPARAAQDFLRHFQTLPWPARSPDLSSVEHVWD